DRLAPVVVDGAAGTATLPDPTSATAARLTPLDVLVVPGAAPSVRGRPGAPAGHASGGSIARPTAAPRPLRRSDGGGSSGGRSAAGSWHSAGSSWYGPGFYGSGTACGQTYTRA